MDYINTTFAHGNGPYSRCVDWAVEVNNVRQERDLDRLPIVVPLVYPGRQERIMKEELGEDYLKDNPHEILFDRKQGELLGKLMFKGADYATNLRVLARDYKSIEEKTLQHLDGKRKVESFDGEVVKMDLRDCAFQLGLNNRMQTGFGNQFYTAGGAGPFDELLERAIRDSDVKLDEEAMRGAFPIAQRMIEDQEIIFSNEPGVFSYDGARELEDNEVLTPPFIHIPKLDYTELPGKGIYLLMTGIDGVRESKMYDAVAGLDMQIYAPKFSINGLPDSIKDKAIALNPNQINNPNIVAQYARAGWSSVWLSHMAKKGFISPAYQKADDPEMIFNERGIKALGLGAIIEGDSTSSALSALEKSIELAEDVGGFNQSLIEKYGTIDGIKFSAEKVVDFLER